MATIRETLEVVDRATGPLRSAGRAAGTASAALLAAGSAAFTLGQRFADMVNDLGDFGTRVGVATETVAGLQLAAEGAGLELGGMEESVRAVQARLIAAQRGSKEAAAGFDQLGISWSDGTGRARALDDVLRDATRALAGISDPAERSRAAMSALGEQGGRLMQALGGSELQDFVDRAREFGVDVGPEAAAAAGRWQREVADLRLVWSGLVSDFGGGIAEVMLPRLNDFTLGLLGASTFMGALIAGVREEVGLLADDLEQVVRDAGGWRQAISDALMQPATPRRRQADAVTLGVDPGVFSGGMFEGAKVGGEAERDPMEGIQDRVARAVRTAGVAMDDAVKKWLATRPGGAVGGMLGGGLGDGEGGAVEAVLSNEERLSAHLAEQYQIREEMEEAHIARRLQMEQERAFAANEIRAAETAEARRQQMAMVELYGSSFSSILGAAQSFAGESLGVHKALGVAQVAVSTAIGVMRAIEQYGPTPAAAVAAAGVIATGIGQIAAITSTGLGSPSFAGAGGIGSGSVSEAVFAPAGEQGATSEASMSGGSTRQSRAIRVETVGGWARVRDFFDELERVGVTLRLEGA